MPPAKTPTKTPIPRGERPSGTRTNTGRARNRGIKAPSMPKKPGPKTAKKKTDLTVPPSFIDAIKKCSKRDGIPVFEFHRLAVKGYTAFLVNNPAEQPTPRATFCPTCMRDIKAPRTQGDKKRLRVTVHFDSDTTECMDWLAENFFNATWSQAFENALRWFMGKDAPALDAEKGARDFA